MVQPELADISEAFVDVFVRELLERYDELVSETEELLGNDVDVPEDSMELERLARDVADDAVAGLVANEELHELMLHIVRDVLDRKRKL